MSSVNSDMMSKRSEKKISKVEKIKRSMKHEQATLEKREARDNAWEYGPFLAETTTVPHFVSQSVQEIAAYWMNGIPEHIGPKQLGYAKACQVISESTIVLTFEDIPEYHFTIGNSSTSENLQEKQDLKISFTIRKPIFQLGPFMCYKKINRRCIECLRELISFYENSTNVLNLIVPIVNRTFDVSKRALEFCCVTKAKRDNVCYKYMIGGQPLLVDVHQQYNQWLKMWKRECFDFFQRYTRIYVPYVHKGDTKLVETTTGQLHGIYWAHTYGVIVYARKNLDTIMHDMSVTHGRNRRDIKNHKEKGLRRPRQPLVDSSSSKGLHMFPVDITVVFTEETDDYEEYSSDNSSSADNEYSSSPASSCSAHDGCSDFSMRYEKADCLVDRTGDAVDRTGDAMEIC